MTAAEPSTKLVAVVTGAAGGLGAALAGELAGRGVAVVLADRNAAGLNRTADDLKNAGATVLAVVTDVTDSGSIDDLARTALDRFGPPTLLVNNAGVELVGKIWELDAGELDRIVRVNLLGAMQVVRAFVPSMIASKRSARIVNISSLGGMGAMPLQTAYIVTKQALLAYSEGLDLELRQFAPWIRVSVVLPGAVNTPIFDAPADADALNGAFRATMKTMLSFEGLAPDEAARSILAQIDEGQFWVSSHPEQLAALARVKGQRIAGLTEPILDEAGEWLMREIGA